MVGVLVINGVSNECDWMVVGGISEVIGRHGGLSYAGKRVLEKGMKKA